MTGHLPKGIRAAVFLSITIVVLAGGCDHPHSTPESATAIYDEVSQVSQALVGKRITIHGNFSLLGKIGPYIWLDSQQAVYLVSQGGVDGGKLYSEMEANSSRRLACSTFITSLAKRRDRTTRS